jgi:preprotein translocase subunit SecA
MKFFKFFDSNNGQVSKTDRALNEIKEWREKNKDITSEQIQKRIKEIQAELKILVDKIPAEEKLSLSKVERGKGLTEKEEAIRKKLNEVMPEVYSYADEVFFRKMGFRYHDVQLRAGIILAQGQRLVEQYTGEGKTMTFLLPLILYSLVGRGAHLVTVNDYLTRRDGEYAGHIAIELGLTVGIINSQVSYKFIPDDQILANKGEEVKAKRDAMGKVSLSSLEGANLIEVTKRESYNADITYGTNNEFGFDYLRDNMTWELQNISQRELYFCIVDEADSILIDEARTPLIISGVPSEADTEKYIRFSHAVDNLEENKHYTIDHKSRSVNLTEDGIVQVETNLGIDNIWKDYSSAYHIENALKAKTLYKREEHYLVKEGEVIIVDEFTGRTLKGRRYSEGLHQAIEAKEGVKIQQESKTFATITFQNFFRLYKILCGGSGTVLTEAEEFYKIYGLESVAIPTNKPIIRIDHPDRIYKTQEAKFRAVIEEVKEMIAIGRPVLIGTASVDKSEVVSALLDQAGISHEVLNAKYHEQEAKIIEGAGRRGAVTVATNMAGRGADIIIGGGKRGDDAWKEISELGGLHVIGTERHEARRIDNQLRGRTGRQGEPGSSRFYTSLEDNLLRVLGGEMMSKLLSMVGLKEDMPIEMGMISRQIEGAQKRIENVNFDYRKRVVDYDDVMNQHREIFYTRRREMLNLSEGANGRFLMNLDLVETDKVTDVEEKSKLKEREEESKIKLRKIVEDIYFDEVEAIAEEVSALRKDDIKETKFEKLMKEFFIIVPVQYTEYKTFVAFNEFIKEKAPKEIAEELNKIAKQALEAKLTEFGDDFYYLSKVIMFQNTDNAWVDHLELMKDIRDGIGLQSYAQKDPLVEYKNEAFNVFRSFIQKINNEFAKKMLNVSKVTEGQPGAARLDTNVEDIKDVSTGDREFVQTETSTNKLDTVVRKAEAQRNRTQATLSTGESNSQRTIVNSKADSIGRNDKVSVRYTDGRELKDVKYKKVEDDLKSGKCVLI